jgi:hypothetical protein
MEKDALKLCKLGIIDNPIFTINDYVIINCHCHHKNPSKCGGNVFLNVITDSFIQKIYGSNVPDRPTAFMRTYFEPYYKAEEEIKWSHLVPMGVEKCSVCKGSNTISRSYQRARSDEAHYVSLICATCRIKAEKKSEKT